MIKWAFAIFSAVLASHALATEVNVSLRTNAETLQRAYFVDVKLLLENGAVNSTSFTQGEIAQGIVSKTIGLISVDAVKKCVFYWAHQPQNGDIKPRDMTTSEEDVACSYNAERNSFEILPSMNVKKLTINVAPNAYESRGATNLLYTLKTHDSSVPTADYPQAIKAVPANGTLTNTHFIFAKGGLSFELGARWLKGGNGTVATDPVRTFTGEAYLVE